VDPGEYYASAWYHALVVHVAIRSRRAHYVIRSVARSAGLPGVERQAHANGHRKGGLAIDVVVLLSSLLLILTAAELFTNAVEWLGHRLNLTEGATGSVLAAVGTALPETAVPAIAILTGADPTGVQVGVGAILGAPFMLSTLALAITGFAAIGFPAGRGDAASMQVDEAVLSRDLGTFLVVYIVAITATFTRGTAFRLSIAGALVAAYLVYAAVTVSQGRGLTSEGIRPLYFGRGAKRADFSLIVLQLVVALAGIVGGAKLFVGAVERLSLAVGVSAFTLSVIIAPVATELPEKFNSLIWVRQGKDTLALGNITGAMVFQSSVLPALGIAATPWTLSGLALSSAAIAVASTATVLIFLKLMGRLPAWVLTSGFFFYVVFIALVISSGTGSPWAWLLPVPAAAAPIASRAYLARRQPERTRR